MKKSTSINLLLIAISTFLMLAAPARAGLMDNIKKTKGAVTNPKKNQPADSQASPAQQSTAQQNPASTTDQTETPQSQNVARIEPPFVGKWEIGILDVLNRLSEIKTVKSIKVEILSYAGSDQQGSTTKGSKELPVSANHKEKLAFIGELLAKAYGGEEKTLKLEDRLKKFPLASGKEQIYGPGSAFVIANTIIIDGVSFLVEYRFTAHPGVFLANRESIIIEPKWGIAMPLILTSVKLVPVDKDMASARREGIAKVLEKYVPRTVELMRALEPPPRAGETREQFRQRLKEEREEELIQQLKREGAKVVLRGDESTSVILGSDMTIHYIYDERRGWKDKLDEIYKNYLKEQGANKPASPSDMKDAL